MHIFDLTRILRRGRRHEAGHGESVFVSVGITGSNVGKAGSCRAHWFGQFYYCGKKVALLFAAIDLLLRAALWGPFRYAGPAVRTQDRCATGFQLGLCPLWVMCGRRLIGKSSFDVDAALVGCGHVSGLFARR